MESTPINTNKTRSESVIIYATSKDITNSDIKEFDNGDASDCSSVQQIPFTLIQSPISGSSSPPIYYFDSNALTQCNVVLGSGWNNLDSDRPTDTSESSINLYDVGSTIQLSPVSENDCSENRLNDSLHRTKLKRGRPKLETITSLIETSDELIGSTIKCNICKRTFPREKSLQAHIRIHTGERPYICDFPDCGRRFAQSGQLRTHQRLHTGEKPFVCNHDGCENRFTHANRRCPLHPMVGVSRIKDLGSPSKVLKSNSSLSNASKEIIDWLTDYYRSIKRQGLKRTKDSCGRPFKARKLNLDLDASDAGYSCEENSTPVWKKKRAALELAKRDLSHENDSDAGTITDNSSPTKRSDYGLNKINLEQLSSDRLMGALALMELANCPVMNLQVNHNGSFQESFDSGFQHSTFNSTFNSSLNDVSQTHNYSKDVDDLILSEKSTHLQASDTETN